MYSGLSSRGPGSKSRPEHHILQIIKHIVLTNLYPLVLGMAAKALDKPNNFLYFKPMTGLLVG